ncbi:uncharacterized protein ARMOST_03240 [Armillaria ostoyae]|uniref:Uncharacterized protein n=1 Tax=Armillaria ostoyae TaxID=47428 RepID=A0A284QTZ9_ARMOS|nr:uncharacterized protein ARMOST_03240 [Armillaria ostoyae]
MEAILPPFPLVNLSLILPQMRMTTNPTSTTPTPPLSKANTLSTEPYRLSSPMLGLGEPSNAVAVRAAATWAEFNRLQVAEQNKRVIANQVHPLTLAITTIICETMGPAKLSYPEDHCITGEQQQQTIE